MIEKCFCGEDLHYTNDSVQKMVSEMVKLHGKYVKVVCVSSGKTYKVPRHYIALHGIKQTLLHTYGFEEINSCGF